MYRLTNWQRVLLLLLLTGAFAIRLHELTRQNIWWDEARNIDVSLRPFWQIPTAPELDIHPPIYFWLLHLWSRLLGLGNSAQISVASLAEPPQLTFIVRSLSAFANVIGIALLFRLLCSWPNSSSVAVAIVAAFIAAASPFWLAESQEARMYTVSFTLLLFAAVGLMEGTVSVRSPRELVTSPEPSEGREGGKFWGRNKLSRPGDSVGPIGAYEAAVAAVAESDIVAKQSRNNLLLFAIFSALALLTHYNALFIVLAWYLWWGCWALVQPQRWLWLRRVVGYGLLMTVMVLPVAPIAYRQIPGYSNPNLTVPTIGQYLRENWEAYLGGYALSSEWLSKGWLSKGWLNSEWLGSERLGSANLAVSDVWLLLIGLLALFGLITQIRSMLGREALPGQWGFLSFLLVWLIGGLGLYYIAVIDRGAFNPRYSSFITPSLYGLVALGIAGWSFLRRPMAAIGVGLLVVGFGAALYADLYDERYAREDMQQTVDWLRENSGPNDVIFVDQKYPAGFYYDRFVIEATDNYPPGPGSPARYLFVDINTIDQRLNQWAAKAERVFWLQWFESDTDPRGSVTYLLDQVGTWSGEKRFRGYTVDWWSMQPPNEFTLAPDMEAATYIFPPAVETVELSIPGEISKSASAIPVAIRWKRVTEGWTDRPLKARVGLYPYRETERDESRKSQDDRSVLNDRHLMPSEWSHEDKPINVYSIPLPADLPVGTYELRLLIYDAESLEPLTYVDLAGNPAGVESVIGNIEIK